MFLKHPMSGDGEKSSVLETSEAGCEIPKGLQLLVQLCYKLWEVMNEEV
jgi:hypothetical protein